MKNKNRNPDQMASMIRKNSFGWMHKSLCTEFDKEMTHALKVHDLNIGQFAILMTLLEKDGLSQTEIGRNISMPGYATTRNIDKLEKNGLLKRHIDKASRRSFCIRLSNEGKELGPTLFLMIHDINEKLLSPLDEDEVQLFKGFLKKILVGVNII